MHLKPHESWKFYTEYWTTVLMFWRVWFEWLISFIYHLAVGGNPRPGQLIWITCKLRYEYILELFVTIVASVSVYLLCRQEGCTRVLEWMSWISCDDWWSAVLDACEPSLSESSRCRVGQRTCLPPLTSRTRSRTARNCNSHMHNLYHRNDAANRTAPRFSNI